MVFPGVPMILENLLVIVLGLIIGSFLNVVIHRLPRDESIIRPGSRCPSCEAPIRWWGNIPVFSYLFLRGRCSACKAPISVRYPVVELLTAMLFLAVKMKFGFSWVLFVRDFPFVAALVAVTFIDIDHRIIPDELSLGGLVLGLLTAGLEPTLGWTGGFLGALLGFASFYGLAVLYEKVSGKSGLGGGDIKLLAMLGAFVGPTGVLTTVLVSSVTGSLVGIGWALATRQRQVLGAAIPYGPFLVLGGLVAYLFGEIL